MLARTRPNELTAALLGFIALLPSCQTAPGTDGRTVKAQLDLVQLTADLSQLKDWFVRNGRQPRALALLSPT